MADSERLFGRYLHHTPCFGEGRTFHHQTDMVKAYKETFGEFPREDIWEIPQVEAEFPGCKRPPLPPSPPGPPSPPPPCPPPPPPLYIKLKVTEGKKEELCMDGGETLGAPVTLQKCNASLQHSSQGFDSTFSEISMGDHSWPSYEEGRCVELVNGDTTNGNHFRMECCKEREAHGNYTKQKFHLNGTTGKISYGDYDKPSTKCVYAKTRRAGEALVIWDCKDVDGQKWKSEWMPNYANATVVI